MKTSTLKPGYLVLSDGAVFKGSIPSWQKGSFIGEAVFNTGMTGYVESITDPSYAGQLLTFTYPLIGNYGVMSKDSWESARIHTAGVILSELAENPSHPKSVSSLLEWLKKEKVPVITGVDTRALTKHLRTRGTMTGVITNKAPRPAKAGQGTKIAPLAPQFVSIKKPLTSNLSQKKTIILVDCGMKQNILRELMKLPAKIKRVPHDYDYSQEKFDGVFISNGPGDPTDYKATIEVLAKAMKRKKPVFGICLGTQIMALAAGAKTYKLPFGHRGHNQPCINIEKDKCFITSQNHGYSIDEHSLSKEWKVTFRNLNDNSVEGIAHRAMPFFSVQFHPEAAPGPTDTKWLFEDFRKLLKI